METSRDFALGALAFGLGLVLVVANFTPEWWSIVSVVLLTPVTLGMAVRAVIASRRERAATE
ncbi:hypothetical protein [Microbacterium sp. ZW T5_56]|uniref:hypothetical protein n=1 Tax=Microbacterium sp. ZW T5_56 TaxID=3378081 RepID=UPI00385506B4